MAKVVTIGRRVLPIEDIVLVEPFDPASRPDFKAGEPFKARVVLLGGDSVLTKSTPKEFADEHGFRILPQDNVATNPAVRFEVENFEPTESYKPPQAFLTRLKWRDHGRNEQSKLLLTKPEAVVDIVLRGITESSPDQKASPEPPVRRARRRRDTAPEQ